MYMNNLLRKSAAQLDCHKFEIPNKSFLELCGLTQQVLQKHYQQYKAWVTPACNLNNAYLIVSSSPCLIDL